MFKSVRAKLTFLFLIFSLLPFIILYIASGFPTITVTFVLAFVITFIVTLILGMIIGGKFAQPINASSSLLWKVARGEISHAYTGDIPEDERGHLIMAYREIAKYLKPIKDYLQALGRGECSQEFQTSAKTDEFGQVCSDVSRYLKHLAKVTKELSERGGSGYDVPLFSDRDQIGLALKRVASGLHDISGRFKSSS